MLRITRIRVRRLRWAWGAGQSNVQTAEGYNHGFDENQHEIAGKVDADFWNDGGLDDDELLAPDGMIWVRELRELYRRKAGDSVGKPREFESMDEYTEYLITEFMKKAAPFGGPFATVAAHKTLSHS